MATKKRVAPNAAALTDEIRTRMDGAPNAYREGDRVVPVLYDLTVQPLEDADDYAGREYMAAQSVGRPVRSPRAQLLATTCMRMFTNAQRSDDGVGLSFMTRNERALASEEWGKRLRELIDAGKRKAAAKGPSVLVDLQDDD